MSRCHGGLLSMPGMKRQSGLHFSGGSKDFMDLMLSVMK